MSQLRTRSRVATLAVSLSVISLAGCSGPVTSPAATATPTAAAASTAAGSELVGDFDVGGRTLHLVCVGPTDLDEPIVLLEAGLESPYQTWSEVLVTMSTEHRLCAYDRAGLGASESAPEAARTASDILTDLKALLVAANVNGPFVLVGHSIGAVPVSLFAGTYPTEVAGVVLVDPRGPRVSGEWLAALPGVATGEPEAVTANRDELVTFEGDPALNDEHLDLLAVGAEAIAALDRDGPLFGGRPVRVLSATGTLESWSDLPPDLKSTFDTIWLDGQQEFADESSVGSLIEVAGSGHEIQRDQPAAVVDAIAQVLAAVAGN